jgi:4-alpha-glucanotransferase
MAAAPTRPVSEYAIRLDSATCRDLEQASELEWWLADGLGGYAAGTVAGVLTRRYHGLLIAPVGGPLHRHLLFAKADASLLLGDEEIPLHSNRWAGDVVSPDASTRLAGFRLEGGRPVWQFEVAGLQIEQRIWMDHGAHRTRVGFCWLGGESDRTPRLRLGLLASFRDHHHVNRPGSFDLGIEALPDGLRLHLPVTGSVEVRCAGGRFHPDHTWIERFLLTAERERGLEDTDHHLRVGWLELPLARGELRGLTLAYGPLAPDDDLAGALQAARRRERRLHETALPGITSPPPGWIGQLVTAADTYLFERSAGASAGRASVIAGYPWFGDWGRDTMIALPGLTLATGRPDTAAAILETFAGYVSAGMLPNTFPGSGERPEYNTVDAALWFIEAWRAWFAATGDTARLRRAFPVLREIVEAYTRGTRFGIARDPEDGLLRAGVHGQQLTWMDARVDGVEVTPRHGKPVEVNALWYNALRAMAELAAAAGEDPQPFASLAAESAEGFARFARAEGGLYDVLDGPHGHDDSIRPNQVFAVSLPHSALDADRQRAVVAECREYLLTPFGLRSLAPTHPAYQGHYGGDVRARDHAYHQGTVWGWLLGHFALAEYRVSGDARAALALLEPMAQQLARSGLGQLSEIFDADSPYAPRGAPAQAWSVACTLEAWWRLTKASEEST